MGLRQRILVVLGVCVMAVACRSKDDSRATPTARLTSSPRPIDPGTMPCRYDERENYACKSVMDDQPITKRAAAPFQDCPTTMPQGRGDAESAEYFFDPVRTAAKRKVPPPRGAKWVECCYAHCEELIVAVAVDASFGKEECVAPPAPDRWIPAPSDPSCPAHVLFTGIGDGAFLRSTAKECCYHSPVRPPPTMH